VSSVNVYLAMAGFILRGLFREVSANWNGPNWPRGSADPPRSALLARVASGSNANSSIYG